MRRSHSSNSDRLAPRSTRLAIGAALVLLLAACGGDDDLEVEDAAAGEQEPTTDETDDTDAEQDAGETAADETDSEAEDTSEDAADGPPAHQPSDAERDTLDCATLATSSPGAVIAFPDANDPASLDAGPGPVTVEVVGCSDTFEANVQYDAFHGQDTSPTLSGFTEGGTLGNWAPFSFEETYWTPGDWTVVVFVDDAESGNRVEFDQVTFTVQ